MWESVLKKLSRMFRSGKTGTGMMYARPTLESLEKRDLLSQWTGLAKDPAGNIDPNWNNPDNWTPKIVPGLTPGNVWNRIADFETVPMGGEKLAVVNVPITVET
jgi:hypothetical protein